MIGKDEVKWQRVRKKGNKEKVWGREGKEREMKSCVEWRREAKERDRKRKKGQERGRNRKSGKKRGIMGKRGR